MLGQTIYLQTILLGRADMKKYNRILQAEAMTHLVIQKKVLVELII